LDQGEIESWTNGSIKVSALRGRLHQFLIYGVRHLEVLVYGAILELNLKESALGVVANRAERF